MDTYMIHDVDAVETITVGEKEHETYKDGTKYFVQKVVIKRTSSTPNLVIHLFGDE